MRLPRKRLFLMISFLSFFIKLHQHERLFIKRCSGDSEWAELGLAYTRKPGLCFLSGEVQCQFPWWFGDHAWSQVHVCIVVGSVHSADALLHLYGFLSCCQLKPFFLASETSLFLQPLPSARFKMQLKNIHIFNTKICVYFPWKLLNFQGLI